MCDGVKNCVGGEDETENCPQRTCQPGFFQCDNGICVAQRFYCDHDDDCGDGSDEPKTCSKRILYSRLNLLLLKYHISRIFRVGFIFAEFATSLKSPNIDTAKNKPYYMSSLRALEIAKIRLSDN